MILAKVIGNVIAVHKNTYYGMGNSLLLVCQITPYGIETKITHLALDSVNARIGDKVLVVQEGWSASTSSIKKQETPIDCAVIGIIDNINQDIIV